MLFFGRRKSEGRAFAAPTRHSCFSASRCFSSKAAALRYHELIRSLVVFLPFSVVLGDPEKPLKSDVAIFYQNVFMLQCSPKLLHNAVFEVQHGKNGFVTATKLGTTN